MNVDVSTQTQKPVEPTQAEELATLRRVNSDLLTKSATRKARVKELEATVSDLESKLTEAATSIHDLTVGGPLKAMAKSISTAPDAWLAYFAKCYKVESIKGELTLLTLDGKPVLKAEKTVPFERDALTRLLTDNAHAHADVFKSITIASRASGAGGGFGAPRTVRPVEKKQQRPQFGLR